MLVYYLPIRVISNYKKNINNQKITTNLKCDANYNTQNVKYIFGSYLSFNIILFIKNMNYKC